MKRQLTSYPDRVRAILTGLFMVAILGLAPPAFAQAEKPEEDEKRQSDEESGRGQDKDKGTDGKVKIDPELQKRIDELLKAQESKKTAADRARASRRQTSPKGHKPPPSPRQQAPRPRPVERSPEPIDRDDRGPEPSGPTDKLDIPPTESDVPPEERKYVFAIKDGTYGQLIEGFSRQTGLGVMGEAPKDGKVTFVSTEELTFAEALSRVRMLLFNYKPHEPYWIDRKENHLKVSRVNDIYRILPEDRMYTSVEAFRTANLPDDELALVIYTPKGSISDLRVVRDFMPDYVRVAPLGGSRVTIFALVKDINKYMRLIPIFAEHEEDPRPLEVIEVQFILPSEAVSKLEQLMDFGTKPRRGGAPRRGKEVSPLDSMAEPEITLLPDDAQGVLLVRAMPDRIEEIKHLLPYIDVDTSLPGEPVIIPVERTDPEELVSFIQQILGASSAPRAPSVPTKTTTRRRTGSRTPSGAVSADGLTLLVHPSQSAIIAIGHEEQIERVRELVAQFDVGLAGPIRIPLKHIEATDLTTTLTLIAGGGSRKGKPTVERYKVVPDPGNDAIWFTGSEKDLEEVRELVAMLDVPGQDVKLRIVRLRNRQPSFVAKMLQEFERTPSAQPAAKPSRSGRGRTLTASKFTPDDENNRLFILCTDSEWEQYDVFIKQLEGSIEESPPFVRVALEHIDPDSAIDQLSSILGGTGGRAADVRYAAAEGDLLVIGASEEQLEDIRLVLPEIDRPLEMERRTFEIVYGDPGEIKSAIDTFLGDSGGSRPPRRRSRPDSKGAAPAPASVSDTLTVVQMGDRLIVDATPEKMEEVAALIAELDVETAATELKVYEDFAPDADIATVSEALTSVFSGRTPGARPSRKGAPSSPADGPRFIPQPHLGKLLVIAEPTMFPEIERLLDVLRSDDQVARRVLSFIDVEFADPAELVEQITPILEIRITELISSGELAREDEVRSPTPKGAAKRRPSQPVETSQYYHIAPDPGHSRIVMAAPEIIIEYARGIVAQFDVPADDEELIFKTVQLDNAGAAQMVKAIREVLGAQVRTGARPAGKGRPQKAGTEGETPLTVVEAPGGGAVVLHGRIEDIEQAIEWIRQLDAISIPGRIIQVYEIEHADIKTLADLIMTVVDRPVAQAMPGKTPPRRRRPAEPIEEEMEFDVTKTWVGQDIYIRADFIASTMIVVAGHAKITQVDEIVRQFDTADAVTRESAMPTRIYELKHADDAFDAALNLEMVLEYMWDPPDELPQVESAFFGNYLIIKYPHEDRFAEIEELIRKYVDKFDPGGLETKRKAITAHKDLTPTEQALWFKMNHPELDIEIVDVSPAKDTRYGVEELLPRGEARPNPCVPPLAFQRLAGSLALTAVGQQESEETQDPTPTTSPEDDPQAKSSDDLINEAVMSLFEEGEEETALTGEEPEPGDAEEEVRAPKVIIRVNDSTGTLEVEGPARIIEDVSEWVQELQDEIKGAELPPDIRIYRVRFIDVYTAAEILEEMFNATRQQRQMIQQQQRMQQQRLRQQQLQQQRQQQQRGQQPGQEPGQQPGQPQRPGQRGQQQPQASIPQLPQTAVRVFPNPRDRSLILRADTNQYPVILKLLATIDQPKPIDSELRTFRLEKLSAAQVEDFLNDFLELDEKPRTSSARTPSRERRTSRTPSRSAPSGYLPRNIMEQMVTGPGMLGVDAKDIKLTSNEEANTIVVMAPKAALDFIGDLIKQLESADIPERVTEYYELKHADAQEIADYLETQYEEEGGLPGVGPRGKGGSGQAMPPLNTPSFVPYARLNLLTVLATAEQMEEIGSLIERLDVAGEEDQWEHVILKHADAGKVAATLSEMFGGTGRSAQRSRGRQMGALPSPAGAGARFIGEEGGRIVLYNAPEGLHEPILDTVQKLEAEAEDSSNLRIIELEYATPSKVAEAVEAAYGSGRGGTGRGRGGATASGARFTITPDDPTKRLFVVADDDMFTEIESLARSLDMPGTIDFDIKIYPLKYADALQVHTQMTKLMNDYVRRLGPAARDMEAFSVEVDAKTNSLIVLGTPTIFGFVEESLAKVDTPANAASPPGFLMVVLKNANAQEVAQSISRLWAQRKEAQTGEIPPLAEANRSLNMLIVRGTQDQLDEIKNEFVDPLEEQAPRALLTEIITLKYADAETVAESIDRIFQAKAEASKKLGQQGAISPLDFTVAVTADPNTGQIIIQAGEDNMALAKARVAELDTEDVAAKSAISMKIYPLDYAEASAVASIINSWAKSSTQGAGRGGTPAAGDQVNATAENATQTVVVTASEANHLIVQELVDGLDDETVAARQGQLKTFNLKYADPGSVQEAITRLFQKGRSPRDQVTAVADYGSSSVVVSASDANLKRVEELLAALDTEESAQREVHVVSLENADAEAVTRALTEIFIHSGPRQKGPEAPPISIAALQASKAVLVKCNADDFAEIETVVAALDREEAVLGEEVRVVPLLYADATEAEAAMRAYLQKPGGRGGRGAELAGDMRLSVLAQSNALMISGGKDEVDRIEARIRELDKAGEIGSVPQIIKLQHADVGQVLPTLQEMFTDSPRGGARRGQTPPVIVASDAGNSLIVQASRTDFAAIESIIRELDTEETAGGTPFRLIPVASGIDVTDLAEKVEESINEGARARGGTGRGRDTPSVTITPDTRTGALIVSGDRSLFDQTEELAQRLVAMGPSGKATKIITITGTPADDIERAISLLKGEKSSTTGRSRPSTSGSRGSSSGSSRTRSRSGR